jgi:integrase
MRMSVGICRRRRRAGSAVAVIAATVSGPGRAYFCSDLRFWCPLLAISNGKLTPASARWVRSWRAWVETAGIEDGPAFRNLRNGRVTAERLSGGGIARMVKRRAEAAGFAPELFSGHSLRSGFATTAARAGVAEHKIMRQGRWTTSQARRGYSQEGELFVDSPSAKLGL